MSKNINNYKDLIKGKWKGKKWGAIVLLADPFIKTDEERARLLQIRPETLCNYKKLPGFIDDVKAVFDSMMKEYIMQLDQVILRDALIDPTESDNAKLQSIIAKSRELIYKRLGLLNEGMDMQQINLIKEFNQIIYTDIPDIKPSIDIPAIQPSIKDKNE